MSDEYRYFLAAGRSLEIVQRHADIRRRHREHLRRLKARLGAAHVWLKGDHVVGFALHDTLNVPPGLRRKGSQNFFAPARRTSEGKALAAEMYAVPEYNAWAFGRDLIGTHALEIGPSPNGGIYLRSPMWQLLGGDYILLVPVGDPEPGASTFDPPDAIPLKASEYWARREAYEAVEIEVAGV